MIRSQKRSCSTWLRKPTSNRGKQGDVLRNEVPMFMPHSLELSFSGVVSEPSEQDDTQLVKASRHGDQMPLPSS